MMGRKADKVECKLLLFSHSVMSDSLEPHGMQHARLPSPSPSPGAYSNLCPLSQWCQLIISSSVVPFSSCFQSFPASGSFLISQLFASGGQSIGASASASVLPMNIQGLFPLGWSGLISLQSKGLSRVFSNTTIWVHEFLLCKLGSYNSSNGIKEIDFPVEQRAWGLWRADIWASTTQVTTVPVK